MRLIIKAIGFAIYIAASFKILAGILSRPVALDDFRFLSSLRTKPEVTSLKQKYSSTLLVFSFGSEKFLKRLHRLAAIDVKILLNLSAVRLETGVVDLASVLHFGARFSRLLMKSGV